MSNDHAQEALSERALLDIATACEKHGKRIDETLVEFIERLAGGHPPRPKRFDVDLLNECSRGDYCICCGEKPRGCPNYEGPRSQEGTSHE